MTRVKICGITNLEDARAAVDYGAHALGFIFVPQSPRYVGAIPEAALIPRMLPPWTAMVAVFRDMKDAHERWLRNYGYLQYYENAWDLNLQPIYRIIRAYRIRDESDLAALEKHKFGGETVLLDAYTENSLGGSGNTFDWELAVAAQAIIRKPIILAGGLTPDNVEEAILKVRPFAVDVSSGVEAEPGRKDHEKLKAFFEAVRRADSAMSA